MICNWILELIYECKYGDEISIDEIQTETLMEDRSIRAFIGKLIDSGYLIGSNERGYYKIRTIEQLNDTIAYREKPAKKMLKRNSRLRKSFQDRKQLKMRVK